MCPTDQLFCDKRKYKQLNMASLTIRMKKKEGFLHLLASWTLSSCHSYLQSILQDEVTKAKQNQIGILPTYNQCFCHHQGMTGITARTHGKEAGGRGREG